MITKPAGLILILFFVLGSTCKQNTPQGAQGGNNRQLSNPLITDAGKTFKVSRDTIQVDIEGKLSGGLLINNKYYAFYEVRDPRSTLPNKKFYIIAKNGTVLREIKIPKGIDDEYYYKLHYWQGHIIVNTGFNKSTYYLLESEGKFLKQPKLINVPLFEDGNYQVTCNCKGEFGSTIYFKNRLTGISDSVNSGCPYLVNRLGDSYFIHTSNMLTNDIIKVIPPVKPGRTNKNASKEVVRSFVATTIFKNDNLASHFNIPTSFIANGVLYYIYNSDDNKLNLDDKTEKIHITNDLVKIGTIDNGIFKQLYVFKDKFEVQLQQQLSAGSQICTFHTEHRVQIGFKSDNPPYKEAKYGFMEIAANQIKIHYFMNKK